jgi:hypothetical protein
MPPSRNLFEVAGRVMALADRQCYCYGPRRTPSTFWAKVPRRRTGALVEPGLGGDSQLEPPGGIVAARLGRVRYR